MAATLIPRARRERMRNWRSKLNSQGGLIPGTWRAECSRWWCMAMSREPRTCDGASPIGFALCICVRPDRLPSPMAISGTGDPMPQAMMSSMPTPRSRMRSAMPRRSFCRSPRSPVAVVSMDGPGLDLLRSGGLIAMGIIKYADIFGDLHLVEFCHRAQFGPIDWEGTPTGQPLRIRGIACDTHNCEDNECGADWQARATPVAMRRPETSNMRREAGV